MADGKFYAWLLSWKSFSVVMIVNQKNKPSYSMCRAICHLLFGVIFFSSFWAMANPGSVIYRNSPVTLVSLEIRSENDDISNDKGANSGGIEIVLKNNTKSPINIPLLTQVDDGWWTSSWVMIQGIGAGNEIKRGPQRWDPESLHFIRGPIRGTYSSIFNTPNAKPGEKINLFIEIDCGMAKFSEVPICVIWIPICLDSTLSDEISWKRIYYSPSGVKRGQ